MAWLNGWAKRVKLTIDQGDIDDALANFPILVHLGTSVGRNSDDVSCVFDELESDANRKKIAVTTSDGQTQCYVEIEKWNDASEKAWLWVKVPAIASDADTDLYLYYDKTKADNTTYVGDPSDAVVHNVWDANFKLVSHMQDDPDTSHIRDSTVNANDGTKKAANEPIEADGKIAKAQDFDGGDDFVQVADADSLDFTSDLTITAWVYANAWVGYDTIVQKPTNFLLRRVEPALAKLHWVWYDGTVVRQIRPNLPDIGRWVRIDAVVSGNDIEALYYDGVEQGLAPNTWYTTDRILTNPLKIGGGDGTFDGLIDEVRISNTARTLAWIKASYESERDHLLDFGSEELYLVIVEGSAAGSGVGLAEATAHLIISASASGRGIGQAEATAKLIVLAEAIGQGIGIGQTLRAIRIIPRIRRRILGYTLGRVKPTLHNLGQSLREYTLGKKRR